MDDFQGFQRCCVGEIAVFQRPPRATFSMEIRRELMMVEFVFIGRFVLDRFWFWFFFF